MQGGAPDLQLVSRLVSELARTRRLVGTLSAPRQPSAVRLLLTSRCFAAYSALPSRFLPFVLLALFAFLQSRQQQSHAPEPPTTEQALRNVIADLTIIQSLSPSLELPSLPLPSLLRAVLILYIPYVLLSFFLPFRVLFAIAGSVVLTWRAPWAIVLRTTVWRSAWFRWSIYKTWALLTGQPLPPRVVSSQLSTDSPSPVQSLRFLFTIYENQRWWMGLDWTAALLPGERPSWCSASQQPLSPPNAFALPNNTTTYLPDGKGGRLKRTATWKWEEPEWRVVVHNGSGLSRVERPLPSLKDENHSSSRLLKAAGKLREPSISSSSGDSGTANADASSQDLKEIEEEPLTDADGWVYGDNKWEAQSNKGGMGKVHLQTFSFTFTNFPSILSILAIESGPVWLLCLKKSRMCLLVTRAYRKKIPSH